MRFGLADNLRFYWGKIKGDIDRFKTRKNFVLFLRFCAALIIVIVSYFGCKHNPVSPDNLVDSVSTNQIWPLKPGNKWWYIVSIPSWPWFSDTLRVEVTGTEVVTYQQQEYRPAKLSYSYSEQPTDWQWLTWVGPDGVYGLGGISSTDTFVVKYLWFKYPAEVGESWPVPRLYFSLSEGKFYIKDTVTYSLVSKDDTLETPVGKFKCYVYEYIKRPAEDVAAEWRYRYYLSPGVGVVALIVTGKDDGREKEKMLLWKYNLRGEKCWKWGLFLQVHCDRGKWKKV